MRTGGGRVSDGQFHVAALTPRRLMKSLLFIVVGSWVGLCVLLYLMQDRLLFLGAPATSIRFSPPQEWALEPVSFTTADGLTLQGQLVRPPGEPAPLLIYYGGNAEEISYLAETADRYGRFALLLVNYRGYGGNPGAANEKALIADALTIHDQALTNLANIRKDPVVLNGRSLGSGVAAAVAAQRPIRALVFTTPYDSLTQVSATHYPFVPVRWLLRHPFNSVARTETIKAPALFLVAGQDNVIPPRHARALFDVWRGPKQWREYSQADHNDIQEAPGYWDTIAAFLKSPPQSTP